MEKTLLLILVFLAGGTVVLAMWWYITMPLRHMNTSSDGDESNSKIISVPSALKPPTQQKPITNTPVREKGNEEDSSQKIVCKHCGEPVSINEESHKCRVAGELKADNGSDDFLVSFAIGAATDNALLGGVVGGDFSAGLLGDLVDGDLFD